MASTAWPPDPVAAGGPDEAARRAAFWRVALLIAIAVFINANAGMFGGLKSQYLLKSVLGLSAREMSLFTLIVGIPSYLRVFMGIGSDLFPLFGFHRRSYYAISWILYAGSYLALAFIHAHYTYQAVLLISIVGALGGNLMMVIMDAVMVTVGNMTGTVGRLQTIQQGIPMVVGATYFGFVSGYVTQHWSYYLCFLVNGLVLLVGIPLTLMIDEKPVTQASQQETEEERAARMALRREEHQRTITRLKQAALSWHLWVIVAYVFYLILTPGTTTAQFYYEVNALHFSKEQIGRLAMPGSIGAILGVLIFAAISRVITVRAVVWTAFLMDCSLYLIAMGLRNYLTAVIVTVVSAMFGMVYNLSLLTLAARATPKGVEGTVYGLVMAATYLAGNLGDLIGSSIFTAFGPPHHSTAHGWFALLWFGFAFTVIAVIFIPFLPAWARSKEPLGSTAEHSPA